MKKTVAIGTLFCFVALISGCSRDGNVITETIEVPSAINENSSTSMDLFTMEVSSLTTQIEFQKSMNIRDEFAYRVICESDTGYYVSVHLFLYYVDKATMVSSILCAKLECNHEGDDMNACNAFFDGNNLVYYDGYLYYPDFDYNGRQIEEAAERGIILENSYSIYRMNLDGTNRTKIQEMEALTEDEGGVAETRNQFVIHNGHVVFCSKDRSVYICELGMPLEQAKALISYDEVPYIIEGPEGGYAHTEIDPWDLWADGDYFYFINVVPNDDGIYCQQLLRCCLTTEEMELVWTIPDENEVGSWTDGGLKTNGWYVTEGVIYYYLSGNGVWKCNLDSGVNEIVVKITDENQSGVASFDEQYIYINNTVTKEIMNSIDISREKSSRGIFVYSLEGKYIGEIDCSGMSQMDEEDELKTWISLLGADDKRLFLTSFCYGADYSAEYTYFIDKNDIPLNAPMRVAEYINE